MSASDWYTRKLRNEQPRREAPLPPVPRVPAAPPPIQDNQFHHQPAPPAKAEGTCPNCGSANYGSTGKFKGQPLPPRCFDCGEGLATQNSTQGLTPPGGPTTAAVQVPSAGYQPQTIVGKVG